MARVLSLGREWSVVVGAAVSLAAACGEDTVVGKRPNAAQDGAVPGGQAGADSGVGGASGGGRASTGGRSSGGAATRTPCTNSLDCDSSQVCDRTAGYCVECAANTDCASGLRCVGQHCRATCTSDKQCTPQGLLCNAPLGVCTECTKDSDCGTGGTCQIGNCIGGTPIGTGGVTSGGGAGGGSANGGASNGGVSNGGGGGIGGAGGVPPTGGAGGAAPGCNRADLWIALDQSGSMADAFDTGTRWDVFRAGVQGFATTATGAAAGIVMFPKTLTTGPTTCCTDADCGTFGPCVITLSCSFGVSLNQCAGSSGCSPSSYDQVDVPLTPLPDTTNVFATFLASVAPGGTSSIAPAFERMRTRAVASAAANPSNKTAMVLVTDGGPTGCTANTVPDIANIATAARSGSPSIKTYVITIGIDPTTMDPVATAGGTTIFGIPTTATLDVAIAYVTTSLGQIAVDACR